MHFGRKDLERFAERLGSFFYALMALAFLAVVVGSPGSGFFFLLVGATAHVGRAAIEEFVARRGREARLDLRPTR